MTNYTASYDTLGNYQEPVNPTPVARAIPSTSQLETEVANIDVPEMPIQTRKGRKKQWIIGSLIVGAILGLTALGKYTYDDTVRCNKAMTELSRNVGQIQSDFILKINGYETKK